MSALVGVLVALAVVATAGTGGRPVGTSARRRPVDRIARPRSAPDLSALLLGVCAQLRAGAAPGDAWSRVLGTVAIGHVPTSGALLTATSRPSGSLLRGRGPAGTDTDGPGRFTLRAGSGVRSRVTFGGRSDDGGVQRVHAVLAAARLSDDLGAPLAGVLERIASAVAADEEADGERRAALAGPRSTAQVLAWLPLLGVALGALLGADPVAVVLSGGIGTASAVLGAVLLLLGRWWTAALLARAGRAGDDRPDRARARGTRTGGSHAVVSRAGPSMTRAPRAVAS
ncbi:type II secretion protein F [Cellulomonas xylanilytica]|uniref:Type II secretion system protein GspF domain-containing protein n=1 Tax=Cellulomonas xylanilytica TaxID=233583 RepID=A0A510V4Q0_9CELL|nr:type II secretion protein F [Cellulomonas xylanilytica]GEK20095.1 hypothetical protein CXY01_06150 [Cellulomonas xylanilytica]